ncbi:MAG: hypothetical protein DWH91_18980 [Planctomycetota bacterium]|nr:MAG: hypothetical protein DWH91_18980 [Planctomycetota bacterium]
MSVYDLSQSAIPTDEASLAEDCPQFPPVTAGTILRFLCGSREAILQIAGSRQATWVGLVLAVLAGFAREYDQESVLHKPWYFLIPLTASCGLTVLLYLACWRTFDRKGFMSLLRCVWFCSPMVLFYAIPVERLSDPLVATRSNLCFLGIVSLWRVCLASRVVSVLLQVGFLRALIQVMFLADSMVAVAMVNFPIPLLQVMGGIQYSPVEEVVVSVAKEALFLSLLSWPVWLILYCISCFTIPAAAMVNCPDRLMNRSVWGVVGGLVALALVGLWIAQPEQLRRSRVEHLVDQNQYVEAIQLMSHQPRGTFPALWEPPPSIWQHRDTQLFSILKVMHQQRPPVSQWVQDVYIDKLIRLYGDGHQPVFFWRQRSIGELEILLHLATENPRLAEALNQPHRTWSERSGILEFVSEELHTAEEDRRNNRELRKKRCPAEMLIQWLHVARQHTDPKNHETIESLESEIQKTPDSGP